MDTFLSCNIEVHLSEVAAKVLFTYITKLPVYTDSIHISKDHIPKV